MNIDYIVKKLALYLMVNVLIISTSIMGEKLVVEYITKKALNSIFTYSILKSEYYMISKGYFISQLMIYTSATLIVFI